jgi:hypothetical protein
LVSDFSFKGGEFILKKDKDKGASGFKMFSKNEVKTRAPRGELTEQ